MLEGGVIGIGVDLCAVSRMEKSIQRQHFVERVFLDGERAYLEKKEKSRAQSAAAMFAAKEAVAKALGTGFRGFGMQDVEILADELGRPVAMLHNGAAARAGGGRVHISISHDGGMALAFAVWEEKEADECAT